MKILSVDVGGTSVKALVTGANSGIGQAVALALAHGGADVVVNYVSRPEAAEAVVKEASRCGANVYAHKANVAKEDEVRHGSRERLFGQGGHCRRSPGLSRQARAPRLPRRPVSAFACRATFHC